MDVTGCNEFYFIAVETSAPYACAVYTLPKDVINSARAEYKRLIAEWKQCLEFDVYPAYSETIQELTMPAWYKAA